MIDGTENSVVKRVRLRGTMKHKSWSMWKGSNFMFSQAFIDIFIHSFTQSIHSSNPSFSIYSLYVLLALFQFLGIKQWMEGAKILALKELTSCGGTLNSQASLRGGEPTTLGNPLSPGHYFQWMCRGRGFLKYIYFFFFGRGRVEFYATVFPWFRWGDRFYSQSRVWC